MNMRAASLSADLERLARRGWRVVEDHHLEKTFSFPSWVQALDFVNRLSPHAEALQHHPDVELSWGRVVIKLRTHDTNDIGELDVQLADAIEALKLG